jgi:hypothetical protein
MDASTRWETEAIRSAPQPRSAPPRPTAKRKDRGRGGTWVTLKEAEEATGIPTNTLRKWVRKDAVDTYLESDGEMALRMVELDSIRTRAKELGRDIKAMAKRSDSRERGHKIEDRNDEIRDPGPEAAESEQGPETMLVPVDAWNKMLSQLGNLHEAGQQLADARERAAKAETEVSFLRERLKEMRSEWEVTPPDEPLERAASPDEPVSVPRPDAQPSVRREATSYWRYLTTGWRNRNK